MNTNWNAVAADVCQIEHEIRDWLRAYATDDSAELVNVGDGDWRPVVNGDYETESWDDCLRPGLKSVTIAAADIQGQVGIAVQRYICGRARLVSRNTAITVTVKLAIRHLVSWCRHIDD